MKVAKKLQVIKQDKNKYILSSGEEIILVNVDSLDAKYVYISSLLLDKNYLEYSREYFFGPLFGKAGRKLNKENICDVIGVVDDSDKITYLQRYYG